MKNLKNVSTTLSLLALILSLVLLPGSSFAHYYGEEKHGEDKQAEEKQTKNSEYSIRNLIELPNNALAGAQPSKTDLQKLSQQGVKTVVNFRAAGEFEEFDEAQTVAANNMTYVHIPIDSKDALNKDNVAKFRAALDSSPDGAFLHCGSGNRVGALFALDAYWNQNKSAEEALAIGEEAGLTKLKDHVETLMVE